MIRQLRQIRLSSKSPKSPPPPPSGPAQESLQLRPQESLQPRNLSSPGISPAAPIPNTAHTVCNGTSSSNKRPPPGAQHSAVPIHSPREHRGAPTSDRSRRQHRSPGARRPARRGDRLPRPVCRPSVCRPSDCRPSATRLPVLSDNRPVRLPSAAFCRPSAVRSHLSPYSSVCPPVCQQSVCRPSVCCPSVCCPYTVRLQFVCRPSPYLCRQFNVRLPPVHPSAVPAMV